MSFPDSPCEPREPRAPRKARPRLSLKMQAIGFLSRREHSRQELRRKLLDSLRRRAREDAALAAAGEKAARERAQALLEQPSNGIDDAFAPPAPAPERTGRGAASRSRAGARAGTGTGTGGSPAAPVRVGAKHAPDTSALDTLSLADGAPLPAALRVSLATAAAASTVRTDVPALAREPSSALTRSAVAQDAFEAFADLDGFDVSEDDLAVASDAALSATDGELSDPETAVDELLDWLVANKYLSETRFVESRVNARSRKQGTMLIKLELSRHGLSLEPEQAAALRETEFARAQALWQRKFGAVATEASARAKQARFLAARGFASDVVRRVVGGEED